MGLISADSIKPMVAPECRWFKEYNIFKDYYGTLTIMFGEEIGDPNVTIMMDGHGKIKKTDIHFAEQQFPEDPGSKAICEYVRSLGYEVTTTEIQLDGGKGGGIEINGGVHKGAVISIFKGMLRIIKLRLRPTAKDPEKKITMTTRRIDLHNPDALERLKETLEELLAPSSNG